MTRESGLYNQWINDILLYFNENIKPIINRERDITNGFNELTFANVFDVLYLLYFGLILSIFSNICEKIFFHLKFVKKLKLCQNIAHYISCSQKCLTNKSIHKNN